jgi:hypothetical protein
MIMQVRSSNGWIVGSRRMNYNSPWSEDLTRDNMVILDHSIFLGAPTYHHDETKSWQWKVVRANMWRNITRGRLGTWKAIATDWVAF